MFGEGFSLSLDLEPVIRRPASRRLRRDACLRVVKPMLVRLLVGRTQNQVLDGLNGDLFFGHDLTPPVDYGCLAVRLRVEDPPPPFAFAAGMSE